jgi:hypothetical protein
MKKPKSKPADIPGDTCFVCGAPANHVVDRTVFEAAGFTCASRAYCSVHVPRKIVGKFLDPPEEPEVRKYGPL